MRCGHSQCLHRQREGASPIGNLLSQLEDLGHAVVGDLGLEVLELVGVLGQLGLDLLAEVDALYDVPGHSLEVVLAEATRGHGRGTDSDTAGGQSALVAGDGVLVAGDVDLLEHGFDTRTV